ncbi:MAG: folate-binding protein [Acetobacteraceae bacterium]|nr:folate-binding protein [Acetobacteraceae bacterium]
MAATMLADRAVLRLEGAELRPFLQGLVTQDVAGLADGAPRYAALLSPQGKVLFDFILWGDGEAVLIDCEAARAEALAKRLALYRLRRAITIAPAPLAVHWAADGTAGVPDPRLAALGRRWLGPVAAPATGWQAHRLRHGVCEGAAELGDGETLWLEANGRELNGVSFTKGCYVGQENTARMHHRAKVNRRLVAAPISDDPRARVCYPALGLMVTLRRVEALGDAHVPGWLAEALAEADAADGGAGDVATDAPAG